MRAVAASYNVERANDCRRPAMTDSTPHFIVDGHEDIAFNMICGGRDYRRSAHETRAREAASPHPHERLGLAMLGLPEWIAGRVAVIFATIFAEPARSKFSSRVCAKYVTPDEAYTIGQRHLQAYRTLTAEGPFRLIRRVKDLEEVIATWDGDREREIGLVLLMENADPIREPEELDEWYEAGLRIIGPAWMSSRYCGGTSEPGPLTDDGRQLLAAMATTGMILDTSHMAEASFFEALERYPGPVIASHSNPRRFVDGDRHLTDEMIRALVARGGVIGHLPFNAFLVPGWRSAGSPKGAADLGTIVRSIDHICTLAGSAQHVAIGSDLDGGFGAEATPTGLDTVSDLQRILAALADRGYRDGDVAAIAHGNWLRMLRQGLG
jgi:membrane dipeptidase